MVYFIFFQLAGDDERPYDNLLQGKPRFSKKFSPRVLSVCRKSYNSNITLHHISADFNNKRKKTGKIYKIKNKNYKFFYPMVSCDARANNFYPQSHIPALG